MQADTPEIEEIKEFINGNEIINMPRKFKDIPSLSVPTDFEVERVGIEGDLEASLIAEELDDFVIEFLMNRVPRIEIIRAIDKIPDSTTRSEVDSEGHSLCEAFFIMRVSKLRIKMKSS